MIFRQYKAGRKIKKPWKVISNLFNNEMTDNSLIFDLQSLPSNTYLLNIQQDGKVFHKKLIVL
jgi:hypothetical protein